MSISKKLIKVIQSTFRQIKRVSISGMKQLMTWLLRILHGNRRGRSQGRRASQAGFVLPTVTMVILVVVLLTAAIMVRSFDRAKNASNVRVNQAVMAAATPGLDRARAKIQALFNDPTLPRTTPSDTALFSALSNNTLYTFGDETRLKLANDINNDGNINVPLPTVPEQDETLNTAWRFPVDTDNNGKYDSYTLYTINFRSPTRDATTGAFNRDRSPLDARTPPVDNGAIGGQCAAALGTSASLVGDSGWYKSGGVLKKSFFVFVSNVPITAATGLDATKYEAYKGNKGFSALEFQQDISRIPISNNAVWFEDDLEVAKSTNFRLNGRVFTNSNMLVGGDSPDQVAFYQVSSPKSCYYQAENSKIIVGGNVANGGVAETIDKGLVQVHRFDGQQTDPVAQTTGDGFSSSNKTTTQTGGAAVGYNVQAYSQRIAQMVDVAYSSYKPTTFSATALDSITAYPEEVKDSFKARYGTKSPDTILKEELEKYFRKRTRRVPYAEVAFGADAFATTVPSTSPATTPPPSDPSLLFGSTFPVIPRDTWMSVTDTSPLALKIDSTLMSLSATEPLTQQKTGKESNIGDRVIVGNNLPQLWYKGSGSFANPKEAQTITGVKWNNTDGTASSITRTRISQVETQPDLGNTSRSGFWEIQASKTPAAGENSGGLRVITGGGIYRNPSSTSTALSTASFLTTPTINSAITLPTTGPTLAGTATAYRVVWPDTMPISRPDNPNTSLDESTLPTDLRMRATVVYHYATSADTAQMPIACVSSYYDPTNATTAKNGKYGTTEKFPWGSAGTNLPYNNAASGRSNNGVSYPSPYSGATRDFSSYIGELRAQAAAIFPNGRLANPTLYNALLKINSSGNALSGVDLTLADYSAIDAGVCSIRILTDSAFTPDASVIPHGTIKEAAFLDGRQVRSLKVGTTAGAVNKNRIAELDTQVTNSNYDLPLEQRQPLEIRATEIDLAALKGQTIGTPDNSAGASNKQEYLLPNSGLVYASREDALPDLTASANSLPDLDTSANTALVSPTDFKLSPTRRPNGIRLINGANLARQTSYRIAEKGLILASDLPIYVKADATNNFNKHDFEEFTAPLATDWSNFYSGGSPVRSTLDSNFACRTGQTGCGSTGDNWRPATIITDSVTLLSNSFNDGFRANGDYDLGNWAGNSVSSDRLYNGFWFNNFVTSASWNASTGYPAATSSYLTNGVTPIQRRVTAPEYIMEICRELPVSKCRPSNWVVGYDLNNNNILDPNELNITARNLVSFLGSQTFNKALLGAGTTASPALQAADRVYARRIAFQRNQYNALVFTVPDNTTRKAAAKVYGVDCDSDNTPGNGVDRVCVYPGANAVVTTATQGVTHPSPAANSLWYFSTSNTTGQPDLATSVTFRNDQPLHYLDPSKGGKKLILPDTPCFTATGVIDCSTTADPAPANTFNLNLPRLTTTQTTYKPGSDYLVCMKANNANSGTSSDYQATLQNAIQCPGASTTGTWLGIENAATALEAIASSGTAPRPIGTGGTPVTSLAASGGTLRANPSNTAAGTVNAVTVANLNAGAVIRLEANGVVDPVFIFYKNSALSFGAGVTMQLDGVSPNNVFWSVGNISFDNATAGSPTRIVGNFLNTGTATPSIGNNVQIEGGRFLGFNVAPSVGTGSTVTASTDDGQPLVVPMLQIQNPGGTPNATATAAFGGAIEDNWLSPAPSGTTTFNAAFVTGDTAARPGETNGGLTNFVRFAENWNGKAARISGSFIQTKKSTFATAPIQPAESTRTDTSLFYGVFSSNNPIYAMNNTDGFRYRGGGFSRTAPFFMPPDRQWGFDVALLTQLPDLFAQRFTLPPTSPPNEYFREVSRDDAWIKTLLCAGAASDRLGGYGATYSAAVSTEYRPSSCPTIPGFTLSANS